jgi:hypothetical protein
VPVLRLGWLYCVPNNARVYFAARHTCPIADYSVNEMYLRRTHAAWFGTHFFLITAVCFAGVFWLIAQGASVLPSVCDDFARKAEFGATWCLGKEASASNPVRLALSTYLHAAGIQAGYSFFAPNVPSHHRLNLELFYDDGRIEYELPRAHSRAAALRLDSLLDRLVEERYEPVREVLIKMLAFSVWREHPDVKKIRATYGSVNPPSIPEFEQGQKEIFQPIFSFDFSLRDEQKQ